ncbi:MAG TPA: tol-pal system protein YbgF [Thermoanaerobaculia bacterium]
MKSFLNIAVVLLLAGCSTSGPVQPATAAPPDVTLAQIQTSLTELLERIDVLNHRMARLEEARLEPVAAAEVPLPPVATVQAQRVVQPAPQRLPEAVPAAETRQRPAGAPAEQPALVAAKLADDYRQALMLFGRGSHTEARRGFELVFQADPSGDLADNALFWIGESHYAARDYTSAIRFYTRVITEYPEENKAPDAHFKLALAIERTGDLALARTTFQQLIERYPYSTPASSAKKELQRIRY